MDNLSFDNKFMLCFLSLHSSLQVSEILEKKNIETEIVHVPTDMAGCSHCGKCEVKKDYKCHQKHSSTPFVNDLIQKIIKSDGLVIGSPTYFSGMPGQLKSLLGFVTSCFS